MKKITTLLISLVISFTAFAQGEANIWHFGWNAGIDFNSGTAVAISSPIHNSEGCAVISDAAGNLLFTTEGYNVYNSAGTPMNVGPLLGDESSSQAALIIPFPGNNSKYYIFTTPITDLVGNSPGFNYSVVDMSLNGGLGGLESMNTNLLSSSCEKLTGVRNTNGTDYWVIMHAYSNNEFYAYPVTASGIGTPVISAIGPVVNNAADTHGCLKSSPNGLKLAAAKYGSANEPVELYDFNPSTGIISNYIPIPSSHWDYGLSFSPDNTKLYIGNNQGIGASIQQYDLTLSNFQNFPFTVFTDFTILGTFQLAPDGKIYCAKDQHDRLGVINNPNLSGAACNYNDSGLILISGTQSRLGLPNFIDSYFASTGSGIATVTAAANNMSVTPNPCTTCEITGATNANDLTVTDILGRNSYVTFSKSANGYYINLPVTASGIFLIRNIKTGEVVKFVQQ